MYKIIKVKSFKHSKGVLRFFENNNNFNFKIKRIFNIITSKNNFRGNHAHKKCRQVFQCLHGKICLNLDNGYHAKKIILNNPNKLVLVENKVWTNQTYLNNENILIVYCDRLYDKEDYIYDYQSLMQLNK